MRRRSSENHRPPEEQIRPEVARKVHDPETKPRGRQEEGPKFSKGRRIFWAVMIFFFISAAAAWASELINAT